MPKRKIRAKKVQAAEQEAKRLKREQEKAECEARGEVWVEPKVGHPVMDDDIKEFVEQQQEVLNVLDYAKDLEITHPSFYQGRIKTADKFLAVAAYMVYGNSRLASKYLGGRVRPGTIRQWKHAAPWWNDVANAIRKAQGEHWDQEATYLLHKASDEIRDRLENGDEVIGKDGQMIRKKVSARDAATVVSTMFDKRALQRGDPTSRSESVSHTDRLKKLEQTFRDMGGEAKVIEGEVIEDANEEETT